MKITPLFDKIVLLPKEDEQESKGGIMLPMASKEKSNLATVVAVGKGGKDIEMQVKTGDLVLFSKYAGTEFKEDNKTYVIVKQADILAIIEK